MRFSIKSVWRGEHGCFFLQEAEQLVELNPYISIVLIT
jgi:hypothetical protein